MSANPEWGKGFNDYSNYKSLYFEISYRPTNALSFSVEPSFTKNNYQMQYVSTEETSGEKRYVVGEINQTIARVSLRMTYMLTPNLSIQYWGQPFGSSGKYSQFKYVTKADADNYQDRYFLIPENWITLEDDVYSIDESNDGVKDLSFDNPDFNFGQFRSNMVIRWEYIPGSTLFLVWTQEMNGAFYDSNFNSHEKFSFEFSDKAHNIFLIKYTYRFVF
jgi:hypothetical protein